MGASLCDVLGDYGRIIREMYKAVMAGTVAARLVNPESLGGVSGLWSFLGLFGMLLMGYIVVEVVFGRPEYAE